MDEDAVAETDFELATRIACGDPEAVRDFVERHGGKVARFLQKKFHDVADDAFQETMMKLVDRANQYDPEKGGLGTWCVRIAQNCALDLLRGEPKDRPEGLHDGISEDRRRGQDAPTPDKQSERRKRLIREAMDTLSKTERAVAEADLSHLADGRNDGDGAPAAALAVRIGTTKNAIYKARSTGRTKLREELERRGIYQVEGQP